MTDNTENQNPQDDIRSTIVSAMETQSTSEAADTTVVDNPQDTGVAEPSSDRSRDEKGQFAKYEHQDGGNTVPANQAAAATTDVPADQQTEVAAPTQAVRPPPGWSPASKAVFDTLPEPVKADIAKREAEMNAGLAKLQDYKGLESYSEHFKKSGYTLPQAFDRYAEADRKLDQDFPTGIVELCSYYGHNPRDLGELLVRSFGGSADQNLQDASGASHQPDIQALLRQHIAPLQQTVNSLQAEKVAAQRAKVEAGLNAFWDDPKNKYIDNVADQLPSLIKQGLTIEEAYEAAIWQNKEIRDLLIKEQAEATAQVQSQAAAKAKQAAKSISGAPGQGSAPSSAPAASLRDDIKNAFKASRL